MTGRGRAERTSAVDPGGRQSKKAVTLSLTSALFGSVTEDVARPASANGFVNLDEYTDDSESDAAGHMAQNTIAKVVDVTHVEAKTAGGPKTDDDAHAVAAGSKVPWPWYRKESSKYEGKFYYVNSLTNATSWKAPSVAEARSTSPSTCASERSGQSDRSDTETGHSLAGGKSDESEHSDAEEKKTPRELPVSSADSGVPSSGNAASQPWRPMRPPQCVQGLRVVSSSSLGSSKQSLGLEVSSGSWVAQQRQRRGAVACPTSPKAAGDEDVTRKIKSILNKLSIEKFETISKQLLECRFASVDHVHILIEEIFERATNQHHYIQMYSDLCELLHEFFSENPVSQEAKYGFKRLLLDECQRSFERNLEPPSNLHKLDAEERTLAEIKYKTKTLGNIRFVGALLAKNMLASKVLVAIMNELMTEATPEALESVAALLTATGPVFDTKQWLYHEKMADVFSRLNELVRKGACGARVRCLLQDLLDLRAGGWQDRRPKKVEAATTLKEVADMAKESLKTVKPAASRRR
jgi:hypothetical protein